MSNLEQLVAGKLLKIKAVKLQPSNPFTWASGWKSPIYCDNRKTLSYSSLRKYIRNEIVNIVQTQYPEVQVIAGVATGAIAQGVLVIHIVPDIQEITNEVLTTNISLLAKRYVEEEIKEMIVENISDKD